ncbi:MAG: hypothetical protein LBG75_01515 [Candidatus Nomurabacteria bacterium]|jgi:hypothetical protein|nr:hypothetical protein [Candidatus Nomurabacteria bacterium]
MFDIKVKAGDSDEKKTGTTVNIGGLFYVAMAAVFIAVLFAPTISDDVRFTLLWTIAIATLVITLLPLLIMIAIAIGCGVVALAMLVVFAVSSLIDYIRFR